MDLIVRYSFLVNLRLFARNSPACGVNRVLHWSTFYVIENGRKVCGVRVLGYFKI